jgi:hypothetical protein
MFNKGVKLAWQTFLFSISFVLSVYVNAQPPAFLWAKSIGGAGTDVGVAINVDNHGNNYLTGYFGGLADFDPNVGGTYNLNSVIGSADIYVAKYDPNGSFIWAKSVGGTNGDYGNWIINDDSNNVYICGSFQNTVDFDPGPGVTNLTSAGNQDIFVMKLDSMGNFVWAKRMGGLGLDQANVVRRDPQGGIYLIGSFANTCDFDPGPSTFNLPTAGGADIFIAKLHPNGNFLWAKAMGGTGTDVGKTFTLDALGNPIIAGWFNNIADFDPGPATFNLTSLGGDEIYLCKLDTGGNFVWAKTMGGTGTDGASSIEVDNSGNIFTIGSFQNTADFDPSAAIYSVNTPSVNAGFISKLDPAGNFISVGAIIGQFSIGANTFVIDSENNLFITGSFNGITDFDPDTGTYNINGNGGIFILKLDSTIGFTWVATMDETFTDVGYSIDLDPWGNVVTSGYYSHTMDFDPGVGTYNITAVGNIDAYMHKVDDCNSTPLTPLSMIGNDTVCVGSSNIYSIPLVLDASSYSWTLPLGWSGNSTTNSISTIAGSSSGFISVTANNLCGASTAQTFFVVSDTVPSAPTMIDGETNVCFGSIQTYGIVPVNGATSYVWTLPAGWTGISTIDSISIIVGPVSGAIEVLASNYCGSSLAQSLSVNVVTSTPTIPFNIDGDTIICSGSANLYSIALVAGASSYSWNLPSGWIGSSVTDSIVVIANSTGGNISVTANNVCGTSIAEMLPVMISVVDTSVSIAGATLTANATGSAYQWLNCTGTLTIPGETNQIFTASSNGNYAVVVAQNGCIDTSSCYLINNVGIGESWDGQIIGIYPNPSNGKLYLMVNKPETEILSLQIYNELGQKVLVCNNIAQQMLIDISNESNGIYLLNLETNHGRLLKKIVISD